MLDGWHEFYILLGTAAAALVALMFVAASIGAGYLSAERASATRTFTSPIIFHYTYVLFLSLAALVPINTDTSLAAIIGISAAAGFINSIFITGPRDAQFRNRHRRSLRIWRQSAGSVRGRTRGVSVRSRAIQCRPSAFGRRAGSSTAGQYPQRLGFDAVFRAAADERKFASLTPAEPNRALLPRLCCASAPWRASSRRRAP